MYGKITIILAIYTVLVFPVTFFGGSLLEKYIHIPSIYSRFLELLIYLIPLYALIIVILGHKSINENEGYGLWLKISMGVGYLIITGIILFIIFIVYKFITEGLNLGGIR
ncbi:MAG: hypothetical protein OQK95_00290 [Gammaproteobacteria bacterium]|nr:hypothetical protein [Gammaproteobacteria bacterium]